MRKSLNREAAFKGEITAFLALIFILMMSLVGALIESASVQINKNRKRANTLLALESVFAEYNRDVFEEYNLFVRSLKEGETIEKRMEYYGAKGIDHTVVKKELLTDHCGQPFYTQAVNYMKELVGIQDDIPGEDFNLFDGDSVQLEETEILDELQNMLSETGEELPDDGNPISSIQTLKRTHLLTLVSEHPETISKRTIYVEELPSNRQLQKGNYEDVSSDSVSEKLFFTGYLLKHFGHAMEADEDKALLYENEYLIGGYQSDEENLEYVCKKILHIRMGLNYAYLLTDAAKQAEAEAMAFSLCSALTVPQITGIVKQALLLSWAYGEGVVDVRTLLKGEEVPLIKTAENWQLQLVNLAKLGTPEEVVDRKSISGGWKYQMYLTGLLVMEGRESLCIRSLDLIESNLHIRTDECITRAEIESQAVLRRGVTDHYCTKFGYQ